MKTTQGNTLTIISIILGVILVALWILWGQKTPVVVLNNPQITGPIARIQGQDISLLIADTPESREKGLGGRESLPENSAMLFVFEEPDRYEFWMKDMKFPIDIIWLDANFRIVHIAAQVATSSYPETIFTPEENSLYALETDAGFAGRNNLKVGERLDIVLNK